MANFKITMIAYLHIFVILFFGTINVFSQTLKVIPDQFNTIQDGVDAAIKGDTVLVKPGVYRGVIDLKGKEILVCSLYSNRPYMHGIKKYHQ